MKTFSIVPVWLALLIAEWPGVVEGAPGGAGKVFETAPVKASEFSLSERKERLAWIWETPRPRALPPVKKSGWALDRIDRFVLQRLEKEGLQPAPPAEPPVWLRRVSFALTGLPPTPEELDLFLKDRSPKPREKVVDRLLASTQFGERWARHWLDLMRYAESRGHESDFIIPNAWEYRDYVVRALNADVPYDAFVREHIAGDVLPKPRRNPQGGFNESLLGTGWAFLGEELHAPVDTRLDETDRIDNRIDVMTKAFLGLTVACARCHDHKFDAISQRDYYALAGFFISSSERLARFETCENDREIARQLNAEKEQWEPRLASKITEAQRPVLSHLKVYLLAAARAVSNAAPRVGERLRPEEFPQKPKEEMEKLSRDGSLDSKILGHWIAALLGAVKDEDDLLRPFALAVFPGETKRKKIVVPPSEAGMPDGARVVMDFGRLAPGEWIADGVAFGLGPVRQGELAIAAPSSTNGPILRVAGRSAAQANSFWRELDLRAGVEREPTLYGTWKRDGVMVRTPKFELTSGKLHYLVRGSGRVLASVDSQRLVTGPLHTAMIREWPYKDRWHWVSQDLSEYAGHRVEIEFSPGNEFDTAIALVVESEKPPAQPWSLAQRLERALEERNVATLPEMAAALQEIFTAASASLRSPRGMSADSAEILNWLAQRPELFSGERGQFPESVSESLRDITRAREALLKRVQWKSRTAPTMLDGNGIDEYLLVRGKHQAPKGLVPRRFLEAISGPEPLACRSGSGRLQLAGLMTDPANPLLARVMVNRVWHHLFGRGLVASVDNFGWLGERPSHPELLDDLAAAFIREDGWSLKHLIRRLVLSQTFAMSSEASAPAAEERDPENLLLHRMNLKRLEGEAIRDAMLAVSGRLDRRMFGPSVPLHSSQFVEARGLRSERGPLDGDGRRSLYIAARRNFLPLMMTAFDTPTPFTAIGRRNLSNVPGQMLFLMNDPFVHQQAEVWARRLQTEMPDASPEERIRRLFLSAFSRQPSARETDRCLAMLREVNGPSKDDEKGGLEPWAEVCHALFGVKEFIYVR